MVSTPLWPAGIVSAELAPEILIAGGGIIGIRAATMLAEADDASSPPDA